MEATNVQPLYPYFQMLRLFLTVLLGAVLLMAFYTSSLFYAGLNILFLPINLLIFLGMISGLLTVPLGAYRLIRKQTISRWLTYWIGLACGFYVGLLIQRPIDRWDEKQRNLSGQLLSAEIEKYKRTKGTYPENLSQLNYNSSLPWNYRIDQFVYSSSNDTYDLDILIPIFDRWHWNKEKNEFEYNDF